MRLTCPNCEAQYEVPDEVIPADGRDVQCSNCGHTWFQTHPSKTRAAQDSAAAQDLREAIQGTDKTVPPPKPADIPKTVRRVKPESEPATAPDPASEAAQAEKIPVEPAQTEPRQPLDPAVADILRQEAQHEAKIRGQETGGLESQPDLGLDSAPEPARDDRAARTRGEAVQDPMGAGSRRELLPDIEEINSSLRSGRQADGANGEDETAGRKRPSAFARGFAVALLIIAVLVMIYGNAPTLSKTVPQAHNALNAYVNSIDSARLWLDTQLGNLLQ